ncbi:MAG: hypothetical protein HGA31_05775 [Candidatus Moranbacteria bacterium]|nr:hypothetical protein [Candidatus Moranbacteria bacterium]
MDVKVLAGNVAGYPANGALVNINDADVATIMRAVSGLVKTTAVIGAGAVVLSLLLNDHHDYLPPLYAKGGGPITSLANIKTRGREFLGVCLPSQFELIYKYQESPLSIATHLIASLKTTHIGEPSMFKGYYNKVEVRTVDGGHYVGNANRQKLSFATILGLQTIDADYGPSWVNDEATITGATFRDVDALRERLQFAMEHDLDKIIETVGRDTFEKFFVLG